MQKIRWFLLILGIVAALAVALQNNAPTKVRFLWLEQMMPLTLLLLTTTTIGFLLGALLTASMLRGRKSDAKRQETTGKPT